MLRARHALVGALLVAAPTASADTRGPALEVGFSGGLFFPSSDHEFFDDDHTAQEPLAGVAGNFEARLGLFPLSFVGVEGELGYITAALDSRDARINLTSLRAQLIAQIPLPVAVFAVAGIGGTFSRSAADALGDDVDRVLHAGTGAKMNVHEYIQLRVDGRVYRAPRLGPGGTHHYAITAGLALRIARRDPRRPRPLDPRETTPPAAPPRPADRDGDGFPDDVDGCPARPETANNYQDDDGCPDELPDRDGDGLADRVDRCVAEPEDLDGFADADGCPDLDNDGDGVLDAADRCAAEAGPAANRGCPDADRDGDGVVDRLDNCPATAGAAAARGCATPQLVALGAGEIEILGDLSFGARGATLRRRSRSTLDQLARVLLAHPEIRALRVEVRAGGRRALELSQARAGSVVDDLVARGVDPTRLAAVGLGADAGPPVALVIVEVAP
jgi:outer membrane protein OmpA-like peptidoglycan-associated protein